MGLGREREETLLQYKIRICEDRERYGLTWEEVAQVLNEETGDNFGESKYRKWWYAFNEGMNYVSQIASERDELVKEYVGEQKKDFQMMKNGEQSSTIVTKLNDEQVKDSDYLLKVHGYDPNHWELTSAKQSIWNNKVDNELYSSRITVKPRVGFNWSEENVRKIFDKLKSEDYTFELLEYANIMPDKEEKRTMLLIGISDLHYGLLAKNSISEEYNMEIAKERFNKILSDVINRKNQDKSVEKVVLLIGNDFLNADNVQGTTSRHFTPQDQETNWYEMIISATEMLIEGIERLKFFFPEVEVINVKGNHDEMSTFGIMQTVAAYYKDSSSVTVNTNCRYRQYIRYGTSLIGASHNEKTAQVTKIMAAETGKDWGETTYHCFLLGHLHHRREISDDYGVDIYGLPTVSGASAWTASEGYVGTNKMSQTFVFDKYKGLVEVINSIVD